MKKPSGSPSGGGGRGQGPGMMKLKELKSQKSIRRQLQRWRSRRWLSLGEEVNLDESQQTPRPLRKRIRRIACYMFLLIGLAALGLAGVILTDVIRLLPCLKADSTCISLALADFEDVCGFSHMPVRLTTTANLPPLFSKLQVLSANIDIGAKGKHSGPPFAVSSFNQSGSATPMVLTGGIQNLTVDSMLNVRNATGLAMIMSNLLNEIDFQIAVTATLKVLVHTPIRLTVPVPVKTNMFLTCGHLPCAEEACKYICQFGDYPLKDPDRSTSYPYITKVDKVRFGYNEARRYIISPLVYVWLTSFKAAATFPESLLDLYYYNDTVGGAKTAFRERRDLDDDHKLFQLHMKGFELKSLEASGGEPFAINVDLRLYNATLGQAATARDFTTRFLRKDPLYLYLAASPSSPFCPGLRDALLTVPPASLSLNTNTSTKDGSDTSLKSLGALKDIFRINSVDLFSLNSSKLRSFVNITLMLPFALEGDLPQLDMDGYAGEDLMGHFRSYPVTLPPVEHKLPTTPPPAELSANKQLKVSDAVNGEANLVIFTEIELSNWGLTRLETIFPDTLTQLEDLDIDLIGSPAPPGNALQAFLSGVIIKLSSLEDNLVTRGDKSGAEGRLFYTPEGSLIKPRVHVEVRSISYERTKQSGLLAYLNVSYADAFQGLFDIRGGSMRFLLADSNDTALATVSVMDSRLSHEMTHIEAEVFIANDVQAEAVHSIFENYAAKMPTSLKILDGVVDTSLSLKEQVPIPYEDIQADCGEAIKAYCPHLSPFETRSCLNDKVGNHVLPHECLRILLPRGALDLEITNVSRLVGVGRGIASGLMDRMKATASKVAINLIEVLSFHTPHEPLDLQMILDENKTNAPTGSQVEVQARTNVSLGILDIIDLTYVVPPLSVAISAPLTDEDLANNLTTRLFTFAVPAMDKSEINGPLLVDSTIGIDNIYQSTYWLENVMADLKNKYVVAQPIATGDIWSYMVEPLQLKVDVLTAINSTESTPKGPDAPVTILGNSNETWSKILFRAKSFPDVIVTETSLAFSRPWNEAIDIKVLPVCMSLYTTFVQPDGDVPLLTNASHCNSSRENCYLGHFKSPTFRTKRGNLVTIETNLNMSATDDGAFWGHLLSDYVAGARVGLTFKSSPECAAKVYGSNNGPFFDLDAAVVLPKLPPLNIPLNDVVNEVSQLSLRALREGRRLSLSEIWASLDPIILSVTQPVNIKVDTVQLTKFESEPIDPLDASSVSLGLDLQTRTVVTIPDIFEVDLDVPPLSMNLYNGNLDNVLKKEGPRQVKELPWASASLSNFVFKSQIENASNPAVHIELKKLNRAVDFAEDLINGGKNITMTLVGAPHDDCKSLFSRVFSHMKIQLDMRISSNVTTASEGGAGRTKETPAATKEIVFLGASLSSSSSAMVLDADVHVPKHLNPLVVSFLMGNMDLFVSVEGANEDGTSVPIAQILTDPIILSQQKDMKTTAKLIVEAQHVKGIKLLIDRMKARNSTLLMIEGVLAADKMSANSSSSSSPSRPSSSSPGNVVKSGLMLTPEVMEKFGLFKDNEIALELSLENLLDPSIPLKIENIGVTGGDEIGSPLTLPCLLKGWCDEDPGAQGEPVSLHAAVLARLTNLSSIFKLPDFVNVNVNLPELPFLVIVDPTSSSLGTITIEPLSLTLEEGAPLNVIAQGRVWDRQGLQQTVFRLWQDPFTVKIAGDSQRGGNDVLLRVLSSFPIAIKVSAPASTTDRVTSLRTLPTVCEGTWSVKSTTNNGFTANVKLPYITLPVPVTMQRFNATVYYQGSAVLTATSLDGTIHIGPSGSTNQLILGTVADQRLVQPCPFTTLFPHLCLLGEALGKIMTFGDSGPLAAEAIVTFQNPLDQTLMQTIRMPLCLYCGQDAGVVGSAATGGNKDNLKSMWGRSSGDYVPPIATNLRKMTCTEANEMVQELYINIEDTVGNSLKFWKSVEVAMKVYMVNIFNFPLEISHLRLSMYFRDPDGVPGESRPSILKYGPTADYCLLYDVDLPTPGLVIPPGQGQWSPLLNPRLDESKLTESLSRLFDEVVVHKRLCADMLGSVIGVTIHGREGEEPFKVDMPLTIRSIPLYRPDACMVPMQAKESVVLEEKAAEEDSSGSRSTATSTATVSIGSGGRVMEEKEKTPLH